MNNRGIFSFFLNKNLNQIKSDQKFFQSLKFATIIYVSIEHFFVDKIIER